MQTREQVERTGPVAGVVLAAGASSRYGDTNKLFLVIEGRTLLRHAVKTALEAGLDPVIVVVGHQRERVLEELRGLPCVPVHNPAHREGIHTSARAGIEAVPEGCPAALVMLADMPFVAPGMLREVVERYRGGNSPLVVSRYGQVDAPPMLYDRRLFPTLREAEGPWGAEVVERHEDEAVVLRWSEARLSDIDYPEDYQRIKAEMAEAE